MYILANVADVPWFQRSCSLDEFVEFHRHWWVETGLDMGSVNATDFRGIENNDNWIYK